MVAKIIVMVVVTLIMLYRFFVNGVIRCMNLIAGSIVSILTFVMFTAFLLLKIRLGMYISGFIVTGIALYCIIYRMVCLIKKKNLLNSEYDGRKEEIQSGVLDILSETIVIAGMFFVIIY